MATNLKIDGNFFVLSDTDTTADIFRKPRNLTTFDYKIVGGNDIFTFESLNSQVRDLVEVDFTDIIDNRTGSAFASVSELKEFISINIGGNNVTGSTPPVDSVNIEEIANIAAGTTLGLEQRLLSNSGQIGLNILAVGFTNTGKVQGVSLGEGNIVEVYATGSDFTNGNIMYREFMSFGEPICFTGVSNGTIITSTQGFYGCSEQVLGINESPMPLLSYGLSFDFTFLFGFRNSDNPAVDSGSGQIHVVNGPISNTIKLTFGDGTVVDGQENIKLEPWEFTTLTLNGNLEYILSGDNPMMACIHAYTNIAGDGSSSFYDSRLVMPLTNDGITWPRSGFVSAPYDNTVVQWYVRDGARWQPSGASIATRPNIIGGQTTLESIIDAANVYATVTFTTPATAPSANNVGAIWESGGTEVGCSLCLNENFGLSVRWGASTGLGVANDGLTSSAALTASTQYTVVVEFDNTNGEVRLHYQAAADASFFSIGRTPEDSVTGANLSDVSGSGDFSLGGTDIDVGGYNPTPTSYAFGGTIDSGFELFYLTSTAMIVSPGFPIDFESATGANDKDYEPNGATRVKANGLVSAYSSTDSAGLEASPLMPTRAMSQVVAQPFYIDDDGDGGNSGVAIASPYEGTAKVYEWNDATKSLDLAYTVPLTRSGVTITSKEDQNYPAAGLISNDAVATNILVGQLDAGVIIADVPITVVLQNGNPNLTPVLRSQNGTTTISIVCDDDETLMLGITPESIACEIREDAIGILRKRVIDNTGAETWEIV